MSDLESKLQELIQIWMDAEQKAGGAVGLAFRACANALEKALADTKRQPNPEEVLLRSNKTAEAAPDMVIHFPWLDGETEAGDE